MVKVQVESVHMREVERPSIDCGKVAGVVPRKACFV